jgi:type IV pilus assembly protein PilA
MKKNNKKGFTLAELLIVVAIIAVLVAIAIPIFTSQLEKSRESTDAANIRDYYAEISSALLTDASFTDNTGVLNHHSTIKLTGDKTATYASSGTTGFTVTVSSVKVNQTQNSWQTGDIVVGGCTITSSTNMVGTDQIIYTFTTSDGNTYLSSISFAST